MYAGKNPRTELNAISFHIIWFVNCVVLMADAFWCDHVWLAIW